MEICGRFYITRSLGTVQRVLDVPPVTAQSASVELRTRGASRPMDINSLTTGILSRPAVVQTENGAGSDCERELTAK